MELREDPRCHADTSNASGLPAPGAKSPKIVTAARDISVAEARLDEIPVPLPTRDITGFMRWQVFWLGNHPPASAFP
jgi:hypothetical protein